MTRATRDRGGPTVASRFLLRIKALLGAQLRGDKIAFQYMGADQQLRSVSAQVNGNQFNGVSSLQGGQLAIEAVRR